MPQSYLICEGPSDVKVLDKIIAQKLGLAVQIYPAGGANGLGAVAAYFKQRFPHDRVFKIEDRDYRSRQVAVDSWHADSTSFIWQRHEIENYLLTPGVVTAAFDLLGQANQSSAKVLPQTQAETEKLLHSLAAPMLENHAGWLTYKHLEKSLNPLKLNLSGTGNALSSRQAWLAHLQQECARLQRSGSDLAVLPVLAQLEIEKLYEQQLAPLQQQDFLTSGKYLLDLKGKKMLRRLFQWLRREQAFRNLQKTDFEEKLIEALEREYQPGYFDPDDFAELATRLK